MLLREECGRPTRRGKGAIKETPTATSAYNDAVHGAGGERHVIDGVDLGRKGQQVVVAPDPGECVSKNQADGRADHSNQQRLAR